MGPTGPGPAGDRLVQRAFKLRFGLKLCLFTLLGGGGLVLLLHLAFARSIGSSYGEAIYTIYDLKIRALPLVFASSYSMAMLALVTAAIAVISVLFSHKIAGPIYRIKMSLERIGGGDLTVVTRFRGNDQLMALSEDINAMVRSLNHAARRLSDAAGSIRDREDRLRELLDSGADEAELREAVRALAAAVEELKRASSGIRLKE